MTFEDHFAYRTGPVSCRLRRFSPMTPLILVPLAAATLASTGLQGPIEVSGFRNISPSKIQEVVKRQAADFEKCVAIFDPLGSTDLLHEPPRSNVVELGFTLEADGRVRDRPILVDSSTVDPPCLRHAMQSWRFPASKTEQQVRVSLRFNTTTAARREAFVQVKQELIDLCRQYMHGKGSSGARFDAAVEKLLEGRSLTAHLRAALASGREFSAVMREQGREKVRPDIPVALLFELAQATEQGSFCPDLARWNAELSEGPYPLAAEVGQAAFETVSKDLRHCPTVLVRDRLTRKWVVMRQPPIPDDQVVIQFEVEDEGRVQVQDVVGAYVDGSCVSSLGNALTIPEARAGSSGFAVLRFKTTPEERSRLLARWQGEFEEFCVTFRRAVSAAPDDPKVFERTVKFFLDRRDLSGPLMKTIETFAPTRISSWTAKSLVYAAEETAIDGYCPELQTWVRQQR